MPRSHAVQLRESKLIVYGVSLRRYPGGSPTHCNWRDNGICCACGNFVGRTMAFGEKLSRSLRWLSAVVLILSLIHTPCFSWDQEELDLFDLVEEIGENFYEVMEVRQDASTAEIRKAYRHFSLQLHPDKSSDPDAAEKFRKMVAVADVLKDEVKREMYDEILEVGLPDWREPVFYYRKMRKMGLLELSCLLLVVVCVGQYLYGWAVYIEKQIVLQDALSRKQKKEQRKSRHGKAALSQQRLEAEVELLNTQARECIPHVSDLLPVILVKNLFQLSVLGWKTIHGKWNGVSSIIEEDEEEYQQKQKVKTSRDSNRGIKKRVPRSAEEEKGGSSSDEVMEVGTETNENKRPNGSNYSQEDGDERKEGRQREEQEGNEQEVREGQEIGEESHHEREIVQRKNTFHSESTAAKGVEYSSKNLMTGKDRALTNKTNSIIVNSAVTTSATMDPLNHNIDKNKGKISPRAKDENLISVVKNKSSKTSSENGTESIKRSVKGQQSLSVDAIVHKESCSNSTTLNVNSSPLGCKLVPHQGVDGSNNRAVVWTQYQQRQLEWALTQYPKFSTDRWQNIARAVPGKSQEECMERCKQLHELSKRRKMATESEVY